MFKASFETTNQNAAKERKSDSPRREPPDVAASSEKRRAVGPNSNGADRRCKPALASNASEQAILTQTCALCVEMPRRFRLP